MKKVLYGLFVLIVAIGATNCVVSRQARKGQQLFAGCEGPVDDKATLRTGMFVCKKTRVESPFGGNGRACGTCHAPGDNFALSPERIANMPEDSPLFFEELEDDPDLIRAHGLIFVKTPDGIAENRQTPKLVHLARLCNYNGQCDSLGLRGDRVRDLCDFSRQAVINHMAKSTNRVNGVDFLLPDREECDALVAYMLSKLVSGQDERNIRRK